MKFGKNSRIVHIYRYNMGAQTNGYCKNAEKMENILQFFVNVHKKHFLFFEKVV